MVNVGSDDETLSPARKAVVNGNDVAWLQVHKLSRVEINTVTAEPKERKDERR